MPFEDAFLASGFEPFRLICDLFVCGEYQATGSVQEVSQHGQNLKGNCVVS